MNSQVIGVYREAEFSPNKVAADRAIMDTVLAHLQKAGARTASLDARSFAAADDLDAEMVLAMCQGAEGLQRLAAIEKAGAIVINSALAIRNCYRDLLGAGLIKAGVPTPAGSLIPTSAPLQLKRLSHLDWNTPMYVKRGDLHALGPDDVQRTMGLDHFESVILGFNRRGIEVAYVQQEVAGAIVKFYGVGDGLDYFSALAPEGLRLPDQLQRELIQASGATAAALGLEVWGGDAIVDGESFAIVDFNDWPSFERVREQAAAAIARRCMNRLRQRTIGRSALA